MLTWSNKLVMERYRWVLAFLICSQFSTQLFGQSYGSSDRTTRSGSGSGVSKVFPDSISARSNNGVVTVTVQVRDWLDNGGAILATGKLKNPLEIDGRTLVLESESGADVEIEVRILSMEDVHYLQRIADAIHTVTSPLRTRSDHRSNGNEDSPMMFDLEAWKELEKKYPLTSLPETKPPAFPIGKGFQPTVKPWTTVDISEVSIGIPSFSNSFGINQAKLAISQDGTLAAVALSNVLSGGKLMVFDLETKNLVCEEEFVGEINPLAFTSNNRVLATAVTTRFGSGLFLWKLENEKLVYFKGYPVFGGFNHGFGAFVGEATLAVSGFFGASIVDLRKDKVLAATSQKLPNISGGLGYVFGVDDSKQFIVDLEKMKSYPTKVDLSNSFHSCISPDGRLFLVHANGKFKVYDAKNGGLMLEMTAKVPFPHPPIFLTNRYVMLGDDIFDLKSRAHVAQTTKAFDFTEMPWCNGLGTIAYVDGSSTASARTLKIKKLLTDEVLAELEEFVSGPSFELKPGDSISVDFSGVPQIVENQIRSGLEAEGLKVEPGSDWVIRGSAKRLAPENKRVRLPDGGETVVNFRPTAVTASLHYMDKEIWRREGTIKPRRFMLAHRGETPQMTAERLSEVTAQFYFNAPVPVGCRLYLPYPPMVIRN